MKIAISIANDLYEEVEHLIRAGQKSRSHIYSQAIREYVARHAPDQITDALDRICTNSIDQDGNFAMALARRTLRHSQWSSRTTLSSGLES